MTIKDKSELIQGGLDYAIGLMAIAANNCFKFGNRNTVQIVEIGTEEMLEIANLCIAVGEAMPLWLRDGKSLMDLTTQPCRILLLADTRKSNFNYDCGACGYKTCSGLNKAPQPESLSFKGPICAFKSINVHMAANAASSLAWRLGLHCRVFSSWGTAAYILNKIPNMDFMIAVAVSATDKDPFFDRQEYWSDNEWDAVFKKEFPTFVRGFLGSKE